MQKEQDSMFWVFSFFCGLFVSYDLFPFSTPYFLYSCDHKTIIWKDFYLRRVLAQTGTVDGVLLTARFDLSFFRNFQAFSYVYSVLSLLSCQFLNYYEDFDVQKDRPEKSRGVVTMRFEFLSSL